MQTITIERLIVYIAFNPELLIGAVNIEVDASSVSKNLFNILWFPLAWGAVSEYYTWLKCSWCEPGQFERSVPVLHELRVCRGTIQPCNREGGMRWFVLVSLLFVRWTKPVLPWSQRLSFLHLSELDVTVCGCAPFDTLRKRGAVCFGHHVNGAPCCSLYYAVIF